MFGTYFAQFLQLVYFYFVVTMFKYIYFKYSSKSEFILHSFIHSLMLLIYSSFMYHNWVDDVGW